MWKFVLLGPFLCLPTYGASLFYYCQYPETVYDQALRAELFYFTKVCHQSDRNWFTSKEDVAKEKCQQWAYGYRLNQDQVEVKGFDSQANCESDLSNTYYSMANRKVNQIPDPTYFLNPREGDEEYPVSYLDETVVFINNAGRERPLFQEEREWGQWLYQSDNRKTYCGLPGHQMAFYYENRGQHLVVRRLDIAKESIYALDSTQGLWNAKVYKLTTYNEARLPQFLFLTEHEGQNQITFFTQRNNPTGSIQQTYYLSYQETPRPICH